MSIEEKPLEMTNITLNSRHFFPNAVTMLSLCSGMTGIFYSGAGNITAAIGCMFLAAILDALDGRVARATGAASKFGAELDSLADVVCFGALPGFVVYQWGLQAFGTAGWIVSLTLPVAAALRLARFNVMTNSKPSWSSSYFTGIPAPAGGFLSLAMIYAANANLIEQAEAAKFALVTVTLVSALMVSQWPTFSGKSISRRALRVWFIPSVVLVLTTVAGAFFAPWATLTAGTLLYVATLPMSKWRYEIVKRRSAPTV